jgi:surface carbohydrate biosynthesis protein (TIGR04326 family)
MKALFIFDDKVKSGKIKLKNVENIEVAYLFPLTSKASVINKIKSVLNDNNIRVEVLNTSSIINQSANEIRNRYIKFIAELPVRLRFKGVDLKEFFATPDKMATLWWFSLVAEKNTAKTDSYNKLSQLHSVVKYAKKINAEHILYGTTCNLLKRSLISYSRSKSIKFQQIPTENLYTLRELSHNLQKFHFLNHFLLGLWHLCIILSSAVVIKKKLKKIRKEKILKNPILIVTYYPGIDIEAARKGVFKNKFYPLVQEELEREGRNIVWVALYLQNDSISFKESVDFAEKFVKNGYNFYFIEEFLDFKGLLRTVQAFALSCFKYLKIRKRIPELHFLEGEDYNFFQLLKNEWYMSFVGSAAISGIVYYERFKNMFRNHYFGDRDLYYFENHAWEKAMIAARDCCQGNMKIIGYQHATVSRMLLNYFNHESETSDKEYSFPMPKPDKIICNGDISYNYLEESGWSDDRLCKAEAIRYNNLLHRAPINLVGKEDIVLVVFSINLNESCAILNNVLEGLRNEERLKIIIKTHPFLGVEVEEVLSRLKMDLRDILFEFVDDHIEDLLAISKVVIAGESGVSVEAFAFGCRVIILDIPEIINMSPLRYIKSDLVRTVDSPDKLRENIYKSINDYNLSKGHVLEEAAEKIIKSFFNINYESNIPVELLKVLN